jgi:transcriptional regulator with GAF, ATPase, and Fis domain
VVDIADALRTGNGATAEAEEPILTLDDGERALVRRALAATKGKINGPEGAAALLGINGSTLRSRMQKLGIAKHVS